MTSHPTAPFPRLRIEWDYTPADLFEAPLHLEVAGGVLRADAGQAWLEMPHQPTDDRRAIEASASALLLRVCHATAIPRAELAELGRSRLTVLHASGHQDHILLVENGRYALKFGQADVVFWQADGTKVDTRADRICRKHRLALLAATIAESDSAARRSLKSFAAALSDPSDELVHLYEVHEAICGQFGGERGMRAALGVVDKACSSFRRLCNDEPVRQGRHRGRVDDKLMRDATADELAAAKVFAADLIERYLEHTAATNP